MGIIISGVYLTAAVLAVHTVTSSNAVTSRTQEMTSKWMYQLFHEYFYSIRVYTDRMCPIQVALRLATTIEAL